MLKIELPKQYKGEQTDNAKVIEYPSSDKAKESYKKIKDKLLDINNWQQIAEGISGDFILTDEQGNDKSQEIHVGDFIKIKLPAPSTNSGEGFDWVKVVDFQTGLDYDTDSEYLFFTIRPSQNPTTPDNNIAHFYTDESSNTFLVLREKDKITVGVHGRNEVGNKNKKADGIVDKIRNELIAIGAIFGMADSQWQHLIDGLIAE